MDPIVSPPPPSFSTYLEAYSAIVMVEAALKEFEAMLCHEHDESVATQDIKGRLMGAYKINILAQNCVKADVKFHEIIYGIYCDDRLPEIPEVFFKALAKYFATSEEVESVNDIWRKRVGPEYPHVYGLVKKCLK